MDKARKRVLMHRPACETQDPADSVAEVPDEALLLRDRSVSVEDEMLPHARFVVWAAPEHHACCCIKVKLCRSTTSNKIALLTIFGGIGG